MGNIAPPPHIFTASLVSCYFYYFMNRPLGYFSGCNSSTVLTLYCFGNTEICRNAANSLSGAVVQSPVFIIYRLMNFNNIHAYQSVVNVILVFLFNCYNSSFHSAYVFAIQRSNNNVLA